MGMVSDYEESLVVADLIHIDIGNHNQNIIHKYNAFYLNSLLPQAVKMVFIPASCLQDSRLSNIFFQWSKLKCQDVPGVNGYNLHHDLLDPFFTILTVSGHRIGGYYLGRSIGADL